MKVHGVLLSEAMTRATLLMALLIGTFMNLPAGASVASCEALCFLCAGARLASPDSWASSLRGYGLEASKGSSMGPSYGALLPFRGSEVWAIWRV